MTKALLSTTYFGPVQWYQKIHRHGLCLIEQHENFQKQTYRNRCIIATANGTQALTVPVIHQPIPKPDLSAKSSAPPITSLLISDHGNWRHLHWNALCSAYGDSPFFEFYADDIQPFFFERRWETLFEFNLDIIHTLCELLDIHPNLQLTDSYMDDTVNPHIIDYRSGINPKHPAEDPDFQPRPYWQVFQQRHGFLPNLSILDLLFNTGPEAIFYL